MIKFKKISYSSFFYYLICPCLYLTILSCGKSGDNTAQQDDITTTSSIVYSGGWGGSTVTISLSSQIISENQANPSYKAILPQIQYAIDTWNTAIGKTVLILNTDPTTYLSQTGNTFTSCNGISDRLYFPLCNLGINGLYYDRILQSSPSTSGWIYNTGKNSAILATTVWNANGSNLTLANMRFNRDYYIFGDTTSDSNLSEDGTIKIIVDLRSVALHELGHVLGLGHATSENTSVMYPTMNIGADASNISNFSTLKTTARILSTCDVNRIRHIYAGEALLPKSTCPAN